MDSRNIWDIDEDNGLIYFTNNIAGTIERMDLDGQNHTVVISGLTNPIGVKMALHSRYQNRRRYLYWACHS